MSLTGNTVIQFQNKTMSDVENKLTVTSAGKWGDKLGDWDWLIHITIENGVSLVAQTVKNLPAMQETQVWSPSREDPLEKEMATHSSIFAWEIPWTEEPGGLQSMGSQELDMTELLNNNKNSIAQGTVGRFPKRDFKTWNLLWKWEKSECLDGKVSWISPVQ